MQIPKTALSLVFALGASILVLGSPTSATAEGLTLEKAYARVFESPYGPRKAGLLKVIALVNDNDTMGGFIADLVANTVTVDVTVATGFDTPVALTGCQATRRGAKCVSDASGTRVKFHATQYRNAPHTYRIKLRVKDIGTAETGTGPLTGPVTVTINQSDAARTDSLSAQECSSKKNGAIVRCRAQ